MSSAPPQNVRVVGRYALYGAIAAGGMATVHLGRLLGPVGFSRTVAIKRLHAQFASDPEFVSMFLDEARLAARIRHPNVVPTLDVVATGGELFLVMDYVPGESIARLVRALRDRQQMLPLRIISAVIVGVLHGLHSAHEANDERGHPLGIVHRDVSPQNVLVGTDGVARVLDFGVAKAAGRVQTTKEGQIKGKLSYMPPEQLRGAAVSRQTDIYACGVMLWEMMTGQRLFTADNEGAVVARVLEGRIERPSEVVARSRRQTLTDQALRGIELLDATVLRALHMQAEQRFATAREMAIEIERKVPPATSSEVGDWVESVAKDVLHSRAAMIAEIESSASHMQVDTRETHVQAVLQAKHTLGPGTRPSASTRVATPQQPSMIPVAPSSGHFPPYPYPGSIEGPPFTQPSSISVSTGMHGAQPNGASGRAVAAAVIGLTLGVSVLAGTIFWSRARHARAAEATLPAVATVMTAAAPTDTPPVGSVSTTGGPMVPPVAVEAKNDESADGGARHPAKPRVVTKPTTATSPAPPPNDCSTPFYYDAQGIKRYKEHCLSR